MHCVSIYSHFSKWYHQNIHIDKNINKHHGQLKSVLSVQKMYVTLCKGQNFLYMVFSNSHSCSTEHYTVIPIWLTTDVYRMTKVNSTMTSREYMISQPPINQCSSLGGTWICMSKMCHEYAIAYCPLGIEI